VSINSNYATKPTSPRILYSVRDSQMIVMQRCIRPDGNGRILTASHVARASPSHLMNEVLLAVYKPFLEGMELTTIDISMAVEANDDLTTQF